MNVLLAFNLLVTPLCIVISFRGPFRRGRTDIPARSHPSWSTRRRTKRCVVHVVHYILRCCSQLCSACACSLAVYFSNVAHCRQCSIQCLQISNSLLAYYLLTPSIHMRITGRQPECDEWQRLHCGQPQEGHAVRHQHRGRRQQQQV